MYQLSCLIFSLGSEIAPGSSGDDSSPSSTCCRSVCSEGWRGLGKAQQLMMLNCYGKAYSKDHKRKKISCSILLRTSLWTEDVLCLSGPWCLFMCIPRNGHGSVQFPQERRKQCWECRETRSLDTWRIWNSNWDLIAEGHCFQGYIEANLGLYWDLRLSN